MKVLISYYSFTGHTRALAYKLSDYLQERENSVELQEIKPENETQKFLSQALSAFIKRNVILPSNLKYDFSGYDIIFLGSPVWAFSPSPAIRSYLLNCKNLKGKFFYLFVTYGSGVGRFRALDIMGCLVNEKGGQVKAKFAISDKKVEDLNFLEQNLFKFIKI